MQALFTSINPRTIYLYSIVIGLLAGTGAIVFNELLHAVSEVTMHSWVRWSPSVAPPDASPNLPNPWKLVT